MVTGGGKRDLPHLYRRIVAFVVLFQGVHKIQFVFVVFETEHSLFLLTIYRTQKPCWHIPRYNRLLPKTLVFLVPGISFGDDILPANG
jgi:hypothetical protein